MARLRSPGYPSFSISDVIEFARKIHDEDRQHPVDRGVAARHMGFSGLSGTSDRALSALLHYGLGEKVIKGEIKVTDLALQILHPESDAEYRQALRTSAFSPELFKELRARYPDSPPSRQSLVSYLTRENFAPAAIGPAAKAFLETCDFLLRERAYESDGNEAAVEPESSGRTVQPDPMSSSTTLAPAAPLKVVEPVVAAVAVPIGDRPLNKINMNVADDRVHLEAVLDFRGLTLLEKKIANLKLLMAPDDDDEDVASGDTEH